MKKFYRAEELFKDIPVKVRSKIFAIAEGKLVYFAKSNKNKKFVNQEDVIKKYAQERKSYKQTGNELGVSKARICQIVQQERQKFLKKRIEYWNDKGLSLRDIARLFKKSHETIRQYSSKTLNNSNKKEEAV